MMTPTFPASDVPRMLSYMLRVDGCRIKCAVFGMGTITTTTAQRVHNLTALLIRPTSCELERRPSETEGTTYEDCPRCSLHLHQSVLWQLCGLTIDFSCSFFFLQELPSSFSSFDVARMGRDYLSECLCRDNYHSVRLLYRRRLS